jgi:hypothetical protein
MSTGPSVKQAGVKPIAKIAKDDAVTASFAGISRTINPVHRPLAAGCSLAASNVSGPCVPPPPPPADNLSLFSSAVDHRIIPSTIGMAGINIGTSCAMELLTKDDQSIQNPTKILRTGEISGKYKELKENQSCPTDPVQARLSAESDFCRG